MKKPLNRSKPGGFALIITLSLMILLTVIAVGLLTLSSISLRASSQSSAMSAAQANARLALVLAIGELQKTTGPDKSVTATSEIFSAAPLKPNLTGAWESWDFSPAVGPDYDVEKPKRFRSWLVSSSDLVAAGDPGFANKAWTGDTIELVGASALGGSTAPALSKVRAGLVKISENGRLEGAYAWHVADESVKARINLYRDPDQNASYWQKRALLAGQRPDTSLVKSPSGKALDFLPTDVSTAAFNQADATTGKIVDFEQVGLLGGGSDIRPFRNDVTPYSLGLMTNVREGGLKQDLSSVFGGGTSNMPAAFTGANAKVYKSTHGSTGVSDPNWSALCDYYNVASKISKAETNPMFTQSPSLDLPLTNIAPPTGFYPGPVIAKVEMLFAFVTRPPHGTPWTTRVPEYKKNYLGHLMYTPVITLHNPYNVSISFKNLRVGIEGVPVGFKFTADGKPQSNSLVPLNDMFYNAANVPLKFTLDIGNWSSASGGRSPLGSDIVMNPGQTLICGPYLEPDSSFSNPKSLFFNYLNNLTGATTPIRAKPGFYGRCIGFDNDWITPNPTNATIPDNGVLALKSTDMVSLEYGLIAPPRGLTGEFRVTAELTSNGGASRRYGGLSFKYQSADELTTLGGKTYTRTFLSSDLFTPLGEPISNHSRAQTFAVFSAYARTSNGGVNETGARSQAGGALNSLLDGQLAGKPFLFHNPAQTVVNIDLRNSKLGVQSHEINFQSFNSNGEVDDYFSIDSTNRTPALTGNTTISGIKSGSFLELPTGPMQTLADFRRSNAFTSSYLPGFVQPVGNSTVSPLMSTSKGIESNSSFASYDLLDHSLLANHALYDRFYFSTFAKYDADKVDSVFAGFMDGTRPLVSQAFEPYLPAGQTVAGAKQSLFGGGTPSATAYQEAAGYQMLRGPFNVNSTNVSAWKAMLGSLKGSQIPVLWAKSHVLTTKISENYPILSMSLPNAGNALGTDFTFADIDEEKTNEWNGYRELDETQLDTLAKKIVEEVRSRGPFLSMSEFVNRRIGPESKLTLRGALAAAIVASNINDEVFNSEVPISEGDVGDAAIYDYKTPAVVAGNPAEGAPGWISQGDLLRILEPAATVRSDTFVIRVAGEARDAAGTKVIARAYAEAVVQRIPDYVDAVDRASLNVYTAAGASAANKKFGRRLELVSFRWLSANEI